MLITIAGASYGLSYYAIPTAVRTLSPANKATQLIHLWRLGHRSLPLTYIATGLAHCWLAWQAQGSRALRFEAITGAVTLAIVPFSIIVIEPTDRKILAVKGIDDKSVVEEVGGAEALDVVAWRWCALNAVRSSMPLIGAAISLYALVTA